MKELIGLILIISGLVLLTRVDDKDNDFYWYDRTYTVLEKNQSEHIYKGQSNPDYYLTVSYNDDQEFNWTKSVSGSTYFSQKIGHSYKIRDTKPSYEIGHWIVFVVMGIGVFVLSYGLAHNLSV